MLEKVGNDYKESASGSELILPSFFVENDYKKHMSVNIDTGLWQCFKTGKSGNFIRLYSILEGITYSKAESVLLFRELENNNFSAWEKPVKPKKDSVRSTILDVSDFIPINVNSYESKNKQVVKAWTFLMERGLLNTSEFIEAPYYLATTGKYRNRLIIPFKDDSGSIFYFQARALSPDMQPKYLNPSVEEGVKASNILYPFNYESDHLIICEGPLDAITLNLHGFNATCTVGSSISPIQMQMLKEFEGKIILGYDNDSAGIRGLAKFNHLRKQSLMPNFYVASPPKLYKDWNEAHVKSEDLNSWVTSTQYEYNYENITKLELE